MNYSLYIHVSHSDICSCLLERIMNSCDTREPCYLWLFNVCLPSVFPIFLYKYEKR